MGVKEFTLEEVLRITYSQLGEISVPVKYTEQIGHPLSFCMDNLAKCITALEENKQRRDEDGND